MTHWGHIFDAYSIGLRIGSCVDKKSFSIFWAKNIEIFLVVWYCREEENVGNEGERVSMNEKVAESLVAVHTHTHFITK